MSNRRLLFAAVLCFAVALMLFAALVYGAQTIAVQTSPDGRWRVEIADFASASKFELWSTPTAGGARRKIGGVVPDDYDVFEFLISSDSSRVVYRQGRTATGESRLYSTPISGPPGMQISQLTPTLGRVDHGLTTWWGGTHVRYRWTAEPGQLGNLYVVPMSGGRILGVVFADGFESGNSGAWR